MGRHNKESRKAYLQRRRLKLKELKVAEKDNQVDSSACQRCAAKSSHALSSLSSSEASSQFPSNPNVVINKYDKKAQHEMTDEEYELEQERHATLVFESLPKELQECFESHHYAELKRTEEEASAKAAAAAGKGEGED